MKLRIQIRALAAIDAGLFLLVAISKAGHYTTATFISLGFTGVHAATLFAVSKHQKN